jgi:hypothetical protein
MLSYIPLHSFPQEKHFVDLGQDYEKIVGTGVMVWLCENVETPWTISGDNKFIFSDPHEALNFKLKFSI